MDFIILNSTQINLYRKIMHAYHIIFEEHVRIIKIFMHRLHY